MKCQTEVFQNLSNTTVGVMNNSTRNNSDDNSASPLGEREWFIIFKYSIFCIIFIISFFGNLLVCFVVCRRMKVKSVTNNFIMNLAISDLLYTLCVPFDVYDSVSKTWPYGAVMCKVFWPAQTVTITASGFTLTALSVTRFWAVVKPLRRQLSVTQCNFVIAILWIVAFSALVPYITFLKYTSSSKSCEEIWPIFKHRQIYTAFLLAIQYVIPLTIISTCYLRIGLELTRGQTKTNNRSLAKARGEEARRVIKMLIIVTLVFAILTLPSSIMWMWADFGQADQKFAYFQDVLDVLNVLDFLNCASNPIIYSFCNESFSREFRRQIGCIAPGLSPNPSSETGRITVPPMSPENNTELSEMRSSLIKHPTTSDYNQNCATKL